MLDNLVDIHCHILPGIDDGPKNYDESLKMVTQAVNQGIKTIIATPHYPYGEREYDKEEVLEKVEILQGKIDTLGLKCDVYPGMELYLSPELLKKIDQEKVIPLKKESRYLLVEFPLRYFSRNLINILHEIKIRGYVPIVAHPERYQFIQDNPLLINEILQQDVLFQINSSSILGYNGGRPQKIAVELIKEGVASFIASDGHSSSWRSIQLSNALDLLKKNIDQEELKKLFRYYGEMLLKNEEINTSICQYRPKKESFFKAFKKVIGFK